MSGSASSMDKPPTVDSSKATEARIWNYWLGGKDNYAVDRAVGAQIRQTMPSIVEVARASRAFLVRVVRYLAGEAGVDQFLDIGTGLPTENNTHQVAQAASPTARIVYVDNDPLVLLHARALLTSNPLGATDYIDADVCDPETILREADGTLDFSRPIALMLLGIMGNVADYTQARSIVDRLVNAMPLGSFVVVNDGTNVITEKQRGEGHKIATDAGVRYVPRTPQQIAGFLLGLEVLPPGVVSTPRWRHNQTELPPEIDVFCGVGRKS